MTAYDYASLGFRPYPETQEFVTIGVVALDAKTSEFGFTLAKQNWTRIHAMFPGVSKELFRNAVDTLQQELQSVKEALNEGPVLGGQNHTNSNQVDPVGEGLFNAITSPKEGLFTYEVKGRRLAKDLDAVLATLKERLVAQKGLKSPVSAENEMAKSLFSLFRRNGILQKFEKNLKVGPAEYQVPFTLAVKTAPNRAVKAIRTLNFDRPTSTEIFNHGDEWVQKLRRLEKLGYQPNHCLFTVRRPLNSEGEVAYRQIREDLLATGAELAEEKDETSVLKFAENDDHLLPL